MAITLGRAEDQVRLLAKWMVQAVGPGQNLKTENLYATIRQSVVRGFVDAVVCGITALSHAEEAPVILAALARRKQVDRSGSTLILHSKNLRVPPEYAILANVATVRELDANGTNFGFDPDRDDQRAGEFGHVDFGPVAIATAQQLGLPGDRALLGMLVLEETRLALAKAFSLKTYKIDHVLHGAIAVAGVRAAMQGGSVDQVASAMNLMIAHAVPYRAIRHGEQLSHSKGSSAAISSFFASQCADMALSGFTGPADMFRNPQGVFSLNGKPPEGESPFELYLPEVDLSKTLEAQEFEVRRMHFKLGLYEHQSAGALQAAVEILRNSVFQRELLGNRILKIIVKIYEPAYGIICDPHKKNPTTRQSADHSLYFILARFLLKARQYLLSQSALDSHRDTAIEVDWPQLVLTPDDYNESALADPETRELMAKIELVHGGSGYDSRYPNGIPTLLEVTYGTRQDGPCGGIVSDLVMFPAGHARNTEVDLDSLLANKHRVLLEGSGLDASKVTKHLSSFPNMSADELMGIYDFADAAISS